MISERRGGEDRARRGRVRRRAMMTKREGTRTAEARLLAMADRLFHDFEELPVRTVFQAIGAARTELRERNGGIASPEDIEALARRRLIDLL
jgi:hypothetical protein